MEVATCSKCVYKQKIEGYTKMFYTPLQYKRFVTIGESIDSLVICR